ncbi:MAG: gliding motility-associated C-terminal domain-containing protein [Chryseolinea sp.]
MKKNSNGKEQMRPSYKYLVGVIFLFVSLGAFSQGTEVLCNDGKDNDGDGIIDCLDGNCIFPAAVERGCKCYDGVDNDGDGRIDQADSNCAPYFGLTFVGEGSNCSITPPGAITPFDLVGPPAVSGQNTADTQSKVSVGDVDGDGIPDVVITSKWNNEVRVIATSNGQADGSDAGDVKGDYNLSGKKSLYQGLGCDVDRLLLEHEVLIADINKDGKAEIFTVVSNRAGNPKSPPTCFFLVGFKYGTGPGGLVPLYAPVYLGTNRPGTFGIADMDGDGKAEIYLRDRIFAAETGKLLASEGAKDMNNTSSWDIDVASASIAVNIKSAGSDGNRLELVVGSKIYTIPTLTARNPAAPAALTLWRDMNTISFDANGDATPDKYFVKLMNDPVEYGIDTHSSASVADIDKDGFQDVVVTGAVNSSVGRTAVFYWNVQKNTVSTYLTKTSADNGIAPGNNPDYTNYLSGWIWGTGRVNIGDANGDGKLDLSFIAGNQLYCVTTDAPGTNIVNLWASPRTINDSRSGVLTVTIYDFDNDGNPEMVYRDAQEVVIVDGATGTNKLWSAVCQSHTYTEGPVIADANGDGATDICVACNRNNAFNINGDIQQQALGEVRMFFSNGNEWLPTRKVWNQPGYFVVNVNDDLTLPFPQLDGALVFSTGSCPNGLPGPQTPMNVFLNQLPYLSADGCPVFPAPDLTFIGDDPENLPYPPGDPRNFPAVVVTPPICGNLDVGVIFNIANNGDLPITAAVPVSFFHGDPTDPTTTSDSLLYSTFINVNNLQVGDTLTTAPIKFNGPGTTFRLYIVLNNNGSVLPISANGSVTNECRIDNNIYDVLVIPTPFTGVIEKIRDNGKCVVADPNVGELRARIFKGPANVPANEVVDYSGYSFQWYYGLTTSNPVPASLGGNNYNLTSLAAGDYTLVVTNTAKGCSALPVSMNVLDIIVLPAVTVTVLSDQTVCAPPNGSLQAVVTGGNTGFSFEWFSNAVSLGITTSTINKLAGDNYIVVVSRNGCSTTASAIVRDLAVEPDVNATATPVQNCQNPNSGGVNADAIVGGVTQDPSGFTFNWYFYNNATGIRGSILPGVYGTGKTRTGLPVGFYQVETINIATQCRSNPFVIQVTDNTVVPAVTLSELAPQTSCDPANPNGRLQAIVTIGGVIQPAGNFTFQWFKGQNTLPANAHTTVSGTNGSIAEKISGGGQSYTVKVTTALQCSALANAVVTENLNLPVVTLTPSPNSICDPALAASNYTGAVSATVTFAGSPVTDFTNYSFKWYNGSTATGTPRTEVSAALATLNASYYTLVVRRTDLSCSSAPITAEVINAIVLPVVTANAVPSTNCDVALANGSAIVTNVDGAGTGSPYKFQWHTGSGLATPISGATSPSLLNLQGGATANYTILVTNSNSGCQNTKTLQVLDNRVLPVLSLMALPNSVCNPALTAPTVTFNGSVSSTVTNQIGAISDYTFAWNDVALTKTKDLLNVTSGSYSLTTKHTPTGCVSNPALAQVIDQTVLPAIVTATTPSTNCLVGLENGQALVTTIDGIAPTATYKMLWHQGMDLTVPIAGQTNALLDDRQGGPAAYFTVLVTNQTSGCQNTATALVADAKAFPVIALSETDNTICAGTKDGSAVLTSVTYKAAAVASPYTGYSFAWSNSGTTASLSQLAAGIYTLKVTKDDVGCTSVPVAIEVHDNLFIPPVNVALVNQTSCDLTAPNGTLTATIDETGIGGGAVVNTGYSFVWRGNGAGPVLTLPGSTVTTTTGTNGQINKLPGNLYYTVEVQRALTGCVNTESVFLPEVIVYPIVVASSTSPVTRCDTPNGLVAANVGGIELGYTFYWMNEVGVTQTTLNTTVVTNADNTGVDNGQYPNLSPGNYTVVAKNNLTSCLSQPATRQVNDATVQTNISITLGPSLPSTCGTFDGELSATVTGGVGTLDLLWHYGGPVNDSINFYNNPPQFTVPNDVPFSSVNGAASPAASALINLESRLYTLVVKDNGNGCGSYETAFLPFLDSHDIAEIVTPSSICPYTVGNGEIDVSVSSIPAIPAGLTYQNFSYSLYKGENPVLAQLLNPPGTVPGSAAANPVVYSALAPGKYTIEIRQEYNNNCPVYKVVEVGSLALPPVVDLIGSLTANTACNLNFSDGGAEISISQNPDDGTSGNTYTLGVSPSPLAGSYPVAGLAAGSRILSGLKSMDVVPQYTVSVTSTNFCVTQRYISIPNKPSIAELVNGNVSHVDAEFCDVSLETSAQIEVTGINIVNGAADNLNDYRFDWYTDAGLANNILSAAGNSSPVKGGEVLSNSGAPLPGSPVTTGAYWVTATKVNAGTTGGVGCFSAPFKVDILDKTVDPKAILTSTANTACDVNYEGSVAVNMSTASGPGSLAGSTYQYQWVLPAGETLPADGSGYTGVSDIFSGVRDGQYTVTASNEVTGCKTTETAAVIKLDIPIVITTVDHTDNEYCFPNGAMVVKDVIINQTPEPDHNFFNFQWFNGTPTGLPIQTGVALDAISNLAQGTYYVIAVVQPTASVGSGCASPPVRADIKDIHIDPIVNIATLANTACDNNFDGQITVNAAAPAPGNTSNYDFTWQSIPAGNVAANGIDVAGPYVIGSLGDGQYTVRAFNRVTQCYTDASGTLLKTPPSMEILTVNKQDQMICLPDGSMQVTAISPATIADYNFRWFQADPTSPALVDAGNAVITSNTLNTINYPAIGKGTYYIIGTRIGGNSPGSGCATPPFRIDINDLSVDPDLTFSFEANSSCNVMNPNGVVLAVSAERDGTTDAYTFDWKLNGGALPAFTTQADASPNSQLNKASEGDYSLIVTNTVTGCAFQQGVAVNFDPYLTLPNVVQVDPIDPTDCFPTGSAKVVNITIGGTSITDAIRLDAEFDYEWYKKDYPANLLPGEVLTALNNQFPDRYYVLVKDLLTDCKSTPVEVVIDNADIIYPDLDIQLTVPQLSCDMSIGTAVLVASADGQNDTNANYSFTWYPSLDVSGTSIGSTSTINSLQSGNYSVEVFNSVTNCKASDLYIVPDNSPQFLPQLSLSTSSRTRCDIDDGSLQAIGVPFPVDPQTLNNYPFAYNYTAELYDNNPPANLNTPEYGFMVTDPNFPAFISNFLQTGLGEGQYTVRLTDMNTGCVTIDHVDLADMRTYPQIEILMDNPLINCDPLRPNGQLSATADGGIVGGYDFQWFSGTTATPPILSNNNKLIGQTIGSYTVLVTNNTTKCPNQAMGTITDGSVLPPMPAGILVQGRTNCIDPNGWVRASVNGATLGYSFDWYQGSVQGTPDYVGVDYTDLDVGPYNVTATDLITGCKSLPDLVEVPDLRVIPEVLLVSTPSYCLRPSGSVNLTIVTPELALTDIKWFDNFSNAQVGSGPATYELPVGYYRAEFISSEGCTNSAEVEIGTDILSYNLVSANGDNSNDTWIIDCIDNFPGNNVKVFNRSGVKVYEADGYNNLDVIFSGIGERGVYALGNDVPDGTYFYIIDKRDGSKPITGYLELVR